MKTQTFLVLFWTMTSLISKLDAQWSSTSGPSGGMVLTLQSNDQYLFAGARNGVYRSADNGENWEHLSNGLPFSFICYDLNAQGDNILMYGTDWIKKWSGIFRCEVYKSMDSGNHWKKISLPESGYCPTEIAIHDNFIFVGDQSLLRSMDDGITWTPLLTWLQDSFDYCRKIEIYDNRLFVTGLHRAWISDDLGDHWEKVSFPSICMGYNLFSFDSLFILVCEDEAFRSIDNGKTWQKSNGWREIIPDYKDIYFQNDTLYANGSSNVLRSVDFGLSWQSVPPDTNYFYPFDLTIHQGQIYACSPINGIQRFRPEADTLQIKDYGIDATMVQSLTIHDHDLWAGVDDYGLFRYDMLTQSWDKKNFFPYPYGVIQTTWFEDRIFIVNLFGQVFRSGDHGQTWKQVFQSELANKAKLVVANNTLYVIDEYFIAPIQQSTDFGDSWVPAFPDFEEQFNTLPVYFIQHHGAYFLNSSSNQLYKSFDLGQTWQEVPTGIDFNEKYIKRLWSEGPYLVLEAYELNHTGDDTLELYVSRDNGISWSLSMDGLPIIKPSSSGLIEEINFIFYNDTMLISAYSQGIFYNTLHDPIWKPLMVEDKFPRFTTSLALDDKKVFVGISGMGVWQMDINGIVSNIHEIQPLFNSLLVNPNPASEEITFQTDRDVIEGILSIIDMQGKTVLNRRIEDLKSISIPVRHLSSGKYTLRLETHDQLYVGTFVKN